MGATVSGYTFEDINDLVQYIKKAKTSTLFKGQECSSKKKKTSSFHDFETFDEAIKALEFGTDLYFNRFKHSVRKVEDIITKKEKYNNTNFKNDIVGFVPLVANAVLGIPKNMINQEKRVKPFPTAKIFLEKSNSACIDSDDMCDYYAIIFVLIQLLEKRGIRCEVWNVASFFEGGYDNDDEIVACKVKLKGYMQPLNVYKIQFPIIATDYFRRIMFRILETTENLKNSWTWGYGHPLIRESGYELESDGKPTKGLKDALNLDDTDIYIPSCQYFDYHSGDNLDKIISKLIKCTNLHNYIRFE